MVDLGCRRQYVNKEVLETFPRVFGLSGHPHFFSLSYSPTASELEEEYRKRNLHPDPLGLIEYARKNPESFRTRLYMCQWLAADGHQCYLAFFYAVSLLDPEEREPAVLLARMGAQLTDKYSRAYLFAGIPADLAPLM